MAGVLALIAAVRAAMGLLEAASEATGRIGLRACCAGLSGAARACPAAGLVMVLVVVLAAVLVVVLAVLLCWS